MENTEKLLPVSEKFWKTLAKTINPHPNRPPHSPLSSHLFWASNCNQDSGLQVAPISIFPSHIQTQMSTLVIEKNLFQQYKRCLYTWTSPDGQYQNQTYYIFCSWRWRNSVQSAKTRPGADRGSDHELLIAKFRLKLKNIGKTNRPFR